MSFNSRNSKIIKDIISISSLVIGSLSIFLSLNNTVSYFQTTPLEWFGVFCSMVGLTQLCSPKITFPLIIAAFFFGFLLDPVFIGGFSYSTWFISNSAVFVFGFVGIIASIFFDKTV